MTTLERVSHALTGQISPVAPPETPLYGAGGKAGRDWFTAFGLLAVTRKLEQAFYCTIPIPDAGEWETVGDIVNYLESEAHNDSR